MAPSKKTQKGLVSALLQEMQGMSLDQTIAPPPAKKAESKQKASASAPPAKKAETKKKAPASAPPVKKTETKKKAPAKEAPKFDNPCQTKETPPERDPLRKFYTSLLRQNPNSVMALKWCLERGLITGKRLNEAVLVVGMAKCKL